MTIEARPSWWEAASSVGIPLIASAALGACSFEDSAKGSGNDPIGNNLTGSDECDARDDCAEPSGSSPTPTSSASDDSEDPATTDEACADAWMYGGMELREFAEDTSGEGAVDCSESFDPLRWVTDEPALTDTVARCFEEALTTGHGAYATERAQGPEYKFGRAWAVTPEGGLHRLSQDPMVGWVYRLECGSLDGYLEGSDVCSTSYASIESLCFYGMLAGASCDTDDDCRWPLICNLESQRCDRPCLSSECLYPDE